MLFHRKQREAVRKDAETALQGVRIEAQLNESASDKAYAKAVVSWTVLSFSMVANLTSFPFPWLQALLHLRAPRKPLSESDLRRRYREYKGEDAEDGDDGKGEEGDKNDTEAHNKDDKKEGKEDDKQDDNKVEEKKKDDKDETRATRREDMRICQKEPRGSKGRLLEREGKAHGLFEKKK